MPHANKSGKSSGAAGSGNGDDVPITKYQTPGDEQLAEIEKALETQPENPDLLEWYAFVLYGKERLQEAVYACQRVIELCPERVRAHYYLGNALYRLGQTEEGRSQWEEVVRLSPDSREGRRARKKLGDQLDVEASEAQDRKAPPSQTARDEKAVFEALQREKLDALAVMARGICHELNNPLMVITGFAEMLQYSLPEDDEESQTSLGKILDSVSRCSGIIHRLSNFASRASLQNPQKVNLSQLVEEVLGFMKGPFRDQAIHVLAQLEEGLVLKDADTKALQLALMSLLSNAQQAMPEGGLLEVTAHREGRSASLTLRDTGLGMTEEEKSHLFEPFYTKKRRWRSIGLGLAEAYSTIQRHSGMLACESQPGQGTCFTVRLPLKEEELPPEVPVREGRIQPSTEAPILLVDEDSNLRSLIGRFLGKRGYPITETGECGKALESMTRGQYSLILMDPQVSGDLLLERMRKLREQDPDVDVMLMVAQDWRIDPDMFLELGCPNLLVKPFSLEELGDTLSRVGY